MKTIHTVLLTIVVAVITSWVVMPHGASSTGKKESAYERVIRTKTLRCGYGVSPPQLMKDPNTKQLSGVDYDVWNAIGRELDIKVEWTEEAGWGNFIEGLQTNRYDAFCSHMWPNSGRAKYLTLTLPITYSVLYPYVRKDDLRFDGHMEKFNDPSISAPGVDGDVSVEMITTHFPKMKVLTLPQTSTVSDFFLSVITKKADVVFLEAPMIADFEKSNPGKLRKVLDVPHSHVFPSYYGFNSGEVQLRDMINTALRTMIDDGRMETIVHGYSKDYIVPQKNFSSNQ